MTNPVLSEMPYAIEKSEKMAPFWDGMNNGELKTTKCTKCNNLHYPPNSILCSKCFGTDIEWVSLPLEGTVETWTHVSAPPAGFLGEYILASVILDKLDKQILGRFKGDKIEIGDRVKVEFENIGDQAIFYYTKL